MQPGTTTATSGAEAALTMSTITTVSFVLIAIFALFAVAIIVVGTVRRRRRAVAREETASHQADGNGATAPVAEAMPVVASPSENVGDLTLLKGLGPRVAAQFAALGITDVSQLATLKAAEAQAIDAQLGSFSGRMARDRWVEQARLLTAGDRAGFEAAFGKLGG